MNADKKQQRRRALKQLRKTQAAHARLLDKVMQARAQWHARTRELRMLEAEIGSLTRRVYQPMDFAPQPDTESDNDRRARLIFNADAHGTKPLKEIVRFLRAHGIIVEVDLKLSDAFVEEVAREAVEGEEELLIVAAGDNTVERVARQLNNSQTALGIVPIGQRNEIASALHIPSEVEAACALIGTSQPRRVDIAQFVSDRHGAVGEVLIVTPNSAT